MFFPKSLIIFKENKSCPQKLLLDFFNKCDVSLSKKNWLAENHSLNNFKSSIDILIKFPNFKCIFRGTNLSVFSVDRFDLNNINQFLIKDSCIFIYEVDSIEEAINLLSQNNQTIVCIGLKKK